MKRVKIVCSAWRSAMRATTGKTRFIQGVCQGVSSANRFCMSMQRCTVRSLERAEGKGARVSHAALTAVRRSRFPQLGWHTKRAGSARTEPRASAVITGSTRNAPMADRKRQNRPTKTEAASRARSASCRRRAGSRCGLARRHRAEPDTETGLPVEEQVRKEWDPKKDGGLPTPLRRRALSDEHADRGLRHHRQRLHRRAGVARRLDRLAVPAALRFGIGVRRAARRAEARALAARAGGPGRAVLALLSRRNRHPGNHASRPPRARVTIIDFMPLRRTARTRST